IPLLDVDIARAVALYDPNIWGTPRTVQAFPDLLVAGRGRAVNIRSVGAVVNTPWIGTYASSKALTSLSDTLRIKLAPLGVSADTVPLGTVTNPFDANINVFEFPPTSASRPMPAAATASGTVATEAKDAAFRGRGWRGRGR
ncbi:hypothetical protein C8R46DRAFT_918394, partial [Mycena filopes]